MRFEGNWLENLLSPKKIIITIFPFKKSATLPKKKKKKKNSRINQKIDLAQSIIFFIHIFPLTLSGMHRSTMVPAIVSE